MDVLVTGGGTIAPIDDVRSIANTSTGNFSAAISEASLRLGARVRHIHAPNAALPFARLARLDFDRGVIDLDRLGRLLEERNRFADQLERIGLGLGTVADYASTLQRALADRPADILFLAMAVSDFEPDPVPGKIDSSVGDWDLRLRPTPKVIRSVRDWAPSAYLVGFKMTSNSPVANLIEQARAACLVNRADLTIANDLTTLREGRHVVHLVRPGFEPETIGPADDLADRVVARVFRWRADRDLGTGSAIDGPSQP